MKKLHWLDLPVGRQIYLVMGLLVATMGFLPRQAAAEDPSHLDIHQALDLAFARSPLLRVQEAALRQAEADLVRGRTYRFNPELDLGMGDRESLGVSSRDYEILLTQEIEIAAQRRKRISVEESVVESARKRLRREQRRLAAEVELAFAETLAWRELMTVAQADADLTRGLLVFAEKRLAAGAGTQVGLNLARVTAGRAERNLNQATAAYKAAGHRLGQALGISPEQRVEPLGDLPQPAGALAPLAELVEIALASRADLNAARRETEAAEGSVALAKALAIPNLKVGIYYKEEAGTDRIKGLGLQIPLPLFNRNQGEIARSLATSERLTAETSAAELQVRREVADAYVRHEAAQESAQALTDLVVGTFEENLSFLQRSLEAGKIDAAQVLVFRREFVESQREYIEVLYEAWAARIHLDLATGTTSVPIAFAEETTS